MTITEYVAALGGMLVCLAVVGLLAAGFKGEVTGLN